MKVTADSITDEQIRELRRLLLREIESLEMLASDCSNLLHYPRNQPGQPAAWKRSDEARARCADAWNARHGGNP